MQRGVINKRVCVLMSGGVDSSVSAAKLKNSGYDVVGVHLKLSQFCNVRDEYDARSVCQALYIPFYVFDITKEYNERVASDLIAGYARGVTPNPDVLCNAHIKFDLVFEKMKALKFNLLATGHYALLKNKKIYAAKDKNKDQTYFLWGIKKSIVDKIFFPIGDMEKSEVRALARKLKLKTSEKKDSQGICFLGDISLSQFLKDRLSTCPGDIIDTQGNVLGKHPGHYFFTVGQRHGLDIKTGKGPYFVVSKNAKKNEIVVGKENDPALFSQTAKLMKINLLTAKDDFSAPRSTIWARCRYRQPLQKATFDVHTKTLTFGQKQHAIAPGQSAVLYKKIKQGFQLLGGGIIK